MCMWNNVKGKSKTLSLPFPVTSQVSKIEKMGASSGQKGIDQPDATNDTPSSNATVASDDQFTGCQSTSSAGL